MLALLTTENMIYLLFGIIIFLCGYVIYLELRMKKLLIGSESQSIEDSLRSAKTGLADYEQFKNESIEYFKNIEARMKRSLQAVETVRFNPFKGTGSGGNQSFATAFVSEKGDGVVISSLYSREHISVFSKPLRKFGSEFEMSEEEKSAVASAKDALSPQK